MRENIRYFRHCWEDAQSHWLAVVITALAFVYSILSEWGVLIALPDWMRPEKWPKLHLTWALVIAFAMLFWIALEGGNRFRKSLESRFSDERQQLEKELEEYSSIGGPELFVCFDNRFTTHPLSIANRGGGLAYNVVASVPEDGSTFRSIEINFLQDNGDYVALDFDKPGVGPRLDQQDFIIFHAMTLPLYVTCMDSDCRTFVYRFEILDGFRYKLVHKKGLGRTQAKVN